MAEPKVMNRLGLSKEIFVLVLVLCGSQSQCYKNDRLEFAASPFSPLPNEIEKYDDYLIINNPFGFRMLFQKRKLKEKRIRHDVRIFNITFEVHV